MWIVLAAIAIGLLVGGASYFLMALYTWTAIHSGWSPRGIQTFYTLTSVVPLVAGVVATAVSQRWLIRRAGRKQSGEPQR